MAVSGENGEIKSRAEKIEKLAIAIKNHPWYENEPIENCRKMAEYQISQWETKNNQREITSEAYKQSQKRMTRQVTDWFTRR